MRARINGETDPVAAAAAQVLAGQYAGHGFQLLIPQGGLLLWIAYTTAAEPGPPRLPELGYPLGLVAEAGS